MTIRSTPTERSASSRAARAALALLRGTGAALRLLGAAWCALGLLGAAWTALGFLGATGTSGRFAGVSLGGHAGADGERKSGSTGKQHSSRNAHSKISLRLVDPDRGSSVCAVQRFHAGRTRADHEFVKQLPRVRRSPRGRGGPRLRLRRRSGYRGRSTSRTGLPEPRR